LGFTILVSLAISSGASSDFAPVRVRTRLEDLMAASRNGLNPPSRKREKHVHLCNALPNLKCVVKLSADWLHPQGKTLHP
jgi:hypothetical protein